jgi:hypothetical protein
MPPKKKPKRNISGLLNQRTTIPAIDVSHGEDAILPSRSPSMRPDLNIDDENDEPDEEWVPNLKFDSNKVKWNDESDSEDDIESDNEEDFLDKTQEVRPGINPRRYRNNGLYVSLMRMAINVGDDLMDEDWVPKKTKKKLRKERKSIHFTSYFNKIFLFLYIQVAVQKNGQKDPMSGVNHAVPAIDIRICLKIRKHLKIWDGRRLPSQIQVCIHQMTRTVTRENQILLAVDLGKMLFKLRFVKIDIQIY